jgi:hypothetical protein
MAGENHFGVFAVAEGNAYGFAQPVGCVLAIRLTSSCKRGSGKRVLAGFACEELNIEVSSAGHDDLLWSSVSPGFLSGPSIKPYRVSSVKHFLKAPQTDTFCHGFKREALSDSASKSLQESFPQVRGKDE